MNQNLYILQKALKFQIMKSKKILSNLILIDYNLYKTSHFQIQRKLSNVCSEYLYRFIFRNCKVRDINLHNFHLIQRFKTHSLISNSSLVMLHQARSMNPVILMLNAMHQTQQTLNQSRYPVAFMSRTLSGSEIYYPPVEKEAIQQLLKQ